MSTPRPSLQVIHRCRRGYSGRHDRADKRAFYAWLAPIAQDVQRRTGIPASITLAQGFRESKSGVYAGYSELMSTYRNLYGMKAGGCTKKLAVGSVNLTTNEYQNGVLTPEPGSFAVYRNAYESTLQHALLFYCARVYAPALAWRSNPYQFLIHIAPYYAPGPAGHYSVPCGPT